MTPLSWIIVGVAVVVIGIVILVANRRMGGMPPVVDDRPGMDLPDRALNGEDLKGVRFAIVSRGYSMGQVDALLDRLGNQLGGVQFQPTNELQSWLDQTPAAAEAAPDAAVEAPAPVVEAPAPVVEAPVDVPPAPPAPVDVPSVPPAPVDEAPAPVAEAPARLLPYVPFPPAPPDEPDAGEAPAISGAIFAGQRSMDEPSTLMGPGPVVVEPWAADVPAPPAPPVEVPMPPAPPVEEAPAHSIDVPVPPVEVPMPPAPPVDEAPAHSIDVPAPPVDETPPVVPAMRADVPVATPQPEFEITGDIRTPPQPPSPDMPRLEELPRVEPVPPVQESPVVAPPQPPVAPQPPVQPAERRQDD